MLTNFYGRHSSIPLPCCFNGGYEIKYGLPAADIGQVENMHMVLEVIRSRTEIEVNWYLEWGRGLGVTRFLG